MEEYGLESKFMLREPSGNLLSIRAAKIALVQYESKITEYRLRFWVNWYNYQQIEYRRLFNFDPDMRSTMSAGNFLPGQEVEISTLLRPDLLGELDTQTISAAMVAAYLEKLSQKHATALLLSTESWLRLSVKQQRPQGETGYRTLWDYLDWSAIYFDESQEADDLLLNAIANFSKDTVARHLAADKTISEANPQVAQVTTQLIETLLTVAPSLFSEDEAAKDQFVDAIADVFNQSLRSQLRECLEEAVVNDTFEFPAQQLSEPAVAIQSTSTYSIFETAVRFFQSKNWTVSQIPGQPILHLYFEGESGRWECYAQAREVYQQFIFYSVLPVKAPQQKRQAAAEYITRANYGIIIGNFEFDFSDGEIRYKTAIGLENSNSDIDSLEQLVHSNVFTVDKYLPGIMKVIDSNISPEEAITETEG